jgi:Radical SAM proteins, N-terminal
MPAFISVPGVVNARGHAWLSGDVAPPGSMSFAGIPTVSRDPVSECRRRRRCKPVAVLSEPARIASALTRSPMPGDSAGTFTPEQWDTAERDETVGDTAWEELKKIIPYSILRKITKPGQYLGNERGAVHPAWDAAEVKMVLAYPDLYSIGMSNTGHVVLYSCINDTDRLLCDRAYLPGPDMQEALESLKKPVFAVESKRSISDFHVVGMSISYELCATNCLKMMQLSHIPSTWEQRDAVVGGGGGRYLDGPPLVFAGGLSVTSNPEPYAAFFDFMSIGDGELMLPAIGLRVADALAENPGISREEIVLCLARDVPGVYAPRFYDMDPKTGGVRRNRDDVPARPQRQNAMPEPWRAMALVPSSDAVHDRLSVEIRRGCTRG